MTLDRKVDEGDRRSERHRKDDGGGRHVLLTSVRGGSTVPRRRPCGRCRSPPSARAGVIRCLLFSPRQLPGVAPVAPGAARSIGFTGRPRGRGSIHDNTNPGPKESVSRLSAPGISRVWPACPGGRCLPWAIEFFMVRVALALSTRRLSGTWFRFTPFCGRGERLSLHDDQLRSPVLGTALIGVV